MKRTIKTMLFSITVLVATASLPVHAAFIGLSPSVQVSGTGQVVTIDLIAGDLGDPVDTTIGLFDVDVSFDNTVLSFVSFDYSDALGSIITNDFFDFTADAYTDDTMSGLNAAGNTINLNLFSFLFSDDLELLQSTVTTLASITFNVIDLEMGEFTDLDLTVLLLGDGQGNDLTGIDARGARVTTEVSAPSSGIIFLMMIVALAPFVRQTKR